MLQNKIQTALQNAKNRGEDEGGFTLIELLVVILIIGILAAIALPTFLGQSDKAKDSSAKSDARNLVSQVESCIAGPADYTSCDTATELPDTGLNIVTGVPTAGEQVAVLNAVDNTGYSAVARSDTGTFYGIKHTAAGNERVCSNAATTSGVTESTTYSEGGCKLGKW